MYLDHYIIIVITYHLKKNRETHKEGFSSLRSSSSGTKLPEFKSEVCYLLTK